jgi:hypothetical protein
VDPGFVAAALGDGRNARVLLKRGGGREALAALTEGDQEPRRESRSSAWQCPKELVVGQFGAEPGDLDVEALDGGAGSAQLRKKRLDEQSHRDDRCGVIRQRLRYESLRVAGRWQPGCGGRGRSR